MKSKILTGLNFYVSWDFVRWRCLRCINSGWSGHYHRVDERGKMKKSTLSSFIFHPLHASITRPTHPASQWRWQSNSPKRSKWNRDREKFASSAKKLRLISLSPNRSNIGQHTIQPKTIFHFPLFSQRHQISLGARPLRICLFPRPRLSSHAR